MKKTKEFYSKYYQEHKERISENRKRRDSTEARKKMISEKNRRYRESHKEEYKEYQRLYREKKKLEAIANGKIFKEKKVCNKIEIVSLRKIKVPYSQKQVIEKLRAFPDCYLWNLPIGKWSENDLTNFEKLTK